MTFCYKQILNREYCVWFPHTGLAFSGGNFSSAEEEKRQPEIRMRFAG